MKTKIKLSNMKFHSHHGVLSQETIIGAAFEVNVLIEANLTKACDSDNVEDTINYADVYDLIKTEMSVPSKLLEHIAGRIYKKLFDNYPEIISLEVSVAKLNPPVDGEMDKSEIVISN
ncbi:MAG: dihydroneopterin aldolase [Fermentimonas sp.]|nr:dihydroneopterin aldolase [Fermentimonas sp.]